MVCFDKIQGEICALRKHQHSAPPEELCADGDDQGRNAKLDDDEPIDPADHGSGHQGGDNGQEHLDGRIMR